MTALIVHITVLVQLLVVVGLCPVVIEIGEIRDVLQYLGCQCLLFLLQCPRKVQAPPVVPASVIMQEKREEYDG